MKGRPACGRSVPPLWEHWVSVAGHTVFHGGLDPASLELARAAHLCLALRPPPLPTTQSGGHPVRGQARVEC